ncbi:MAG: hypothetical protein ACYDBH_03635 [Acidobacteriaceae bacterium]
MKQANLDSALLEFRIEAGDGPKPTILEAYCRRYPQYARELTDYALEWLIDETLAGTEAASDVAVNSSSPLVSRAISRLYDRICERETGKEAATGLSGQQAVNPFEGLPLTRVRTIRDELGINTPLFTKFRSRLIDPTTVPRAFLERFARLLDRTVEELRDYLSLPPTVHIGADYKAEGKPTVTGCKESFEDGIRSSSLDEKQKRALLKV